MIECIKKDFEINIFAFSSGELLPKFKSLGVRVTFGQNNFFSIFRFIHFLIFNKTDIYHFFLPKSYIIGGLFTIFSKKKKIMSRRSLNSYHKKFFFVSLIIEKFLHKRMDLILTNTSAIKHQLVNYEDVPVEQIKVIPNFVTSLIAKRKKSNSKIIKIGYVANFIPYKNHILLLDICSRIDIKKKWQVILVGSDVKGFKKKIKNRISELNLNKKVKLLEPQKKIDQFYKEINFSWSTSSEEGSSNFLLESIFHGLPIIAFDVGGNKDFFNKNGFLIPTYDFETMKKKVEYMILNDLSRFQTNSLKICKRKFNNKNNIKLYTSNYNS